MGHRFSLVLMSALTGVTSIEQAAAQDVGAGTATPSASPSQTSNTPQSGAEQITVVGVAKELSVLPTSLTSSTAYGIDLNVMETPRNNTVLTHAQLAAL